MNNSSSNIKKGTIITYITQFLGIGISFIYVPIMLGILGQKEYGLYALVQSLVSYLQMSEMGIGVTATRYNAKYIALKDEDGQGKINGMFLLLYLGIALFCVIAGLIFYYYIPSVYSDYSSDSIDLIRVLFILALANLVIHMVFKLFNAVIIAYEKFIFIKTLSLIQTVLGPVCMLAVLYMGKRSIGMLTVTTILSLIFGLIQMFYCFKYLRIKLKFGHFEKGLFYTIFSFTIFVFLNSLSHQLFSNSDKIIISILMSETAIAIYAIVLQFVTYYYMFSNVISGFYLPRFTKAVSETRMVSKPLMEELIRTARIQVMIAGLIFGGFAAIGKPFIVRWVGVEYESAYILSVIVLATEFIGSSQSMFNSLMQAMNLHKVRALLGLGCAVIKVVTTVFAVKWFGLIGAALIYLIVYIFRLFVYNVYYKVRVGIDIRVFWSQIMKLFIPLIAVIALFYFVFYTAMSFLPANGYPVIILYVVLYIVLFGCVCWFILMNDYERNLLISLIRKTK